MEVSVLLGWDAHPGTEAEPALVLDEPVGERGPGSGGIITGDTCCSRDPV